MTSKNLYNRLYDLDGTRGKKTEYDEGAKKMKKNAWHKFCEEYAQAHSVSFGAAISLAGPAWRAHKEKHGLEFKDRSAERERTKERAKQKKEEKRLEKEYFKEKKAKENKKSVIMDFYSSSDEDASEQSPQPQRRRRENSGGGKRRNEKAGGKRERNSPEGYGDDHTTEYKTKESEHYSGRDIGTPPPRKRVKETHPDSPRHYSKSVKDSQQPHRPKNKQHHQRQEIPRYENPNEVD